MYKSSLYIGTEWYTFCFRNKRLICGLLGVRFGETFLMGCWEEMTVIIIKWKNVSCEIDDFVETDPCKLRGILRSRVLRVLCNLIKKVSLFCGGQHLTAVELRGRINLWLWIYVRPYIQLVDVIWLTVVRGGINCRTSLGESGKLFLVIGHKIWVGNGGSIILFLRDVFNNRGVGGERKDYA